MVVRFMIFVPFLFLSIVCEAHQPDDTAGGA